MMKLIGVLVFLFTFLGAGMSTEDPKRVKEVVTDNFKKLGMYYGLRGTELRRWWGGKQFYVLVNKRMLRIRLYNRENKSTVRIAWNCLNRSHVFVQMRPEKKWDKLKKMLTQVEDIQVFEDGIDEGMLIESNDRKFLLLGLPQDFYQRGRHLKVDLGEVLVKSNQVVYEEEIRSTKYQNAQRLIEITQWLKELAEHTESWKKE